MRTTDSILMRNLWPALKFQTRAENFFLQKQRSPGPVSPYVRIRPGIHKMYVMLFPIVLKPVFTIRRGFLLRLSGRTSLLHKKNETAAYPDEDRPTNLAILAGY